MAADLTVAVLGLGEAGSAIAADLVAAGAAARGYDPAGTTVDGVHDARDEAEAVRGADLVLSVNAAAVAPDVARAAAGGLRRGQLYADLNTSAPALKRELAGVIEPTGAAFADVGLLRPVPGNGIRTPALVSGPGASAFAQAMAPLGMPVTEVGPDPGEAAARKLARSVFMKGLTAAIAESLAAAEGGGWAGWGRGDPRAEPAPAGARLLAPPRGGARPPPGRRT